MDPVSLVILSAATGGATGKVAEKAIDYLHDILTGQDEDVKRKAAENAAQMLSRLEGRIERLENQHIEAALGDPDVAHCVKVAVIGAARTGSEQKHELLAGLVATRLIAKDESVVALATNLALEAVPSLTPEQFEYLGLASLVYVLRPPGLPLDSTVTPPEGRDTTDEEDNAIKGYFPWFTDLFEDLAIPVIAGSDEAHLVSAGCMVRDSGVRRSLPEVLRPFSGRWISIAGSHHLEQRLAQFLTLEERGRQLQRLWHKSMQYHSPTPVGTVIGTLVIELQTGEDLDLDSLKRVHAGSAGLVDDSVWDGRRIREDFLRALDDAIRERVERGGIWSNLERR